MSMLFAREGMYIFHHQSSPNNRWPGVRSLADYMQQCGRAGRDGEEAECITFYRPSDAQEMRASVGWTCKVGPQQPLNHF